MSERPFKGEPVDNFTPDSGKLNFVVEIEGTGKLVAPVMGWSIIEGSLEPVVMVNSTVFTTVTQYVAEVNAKLPEGTTAKVSFEASHPLMPTARPPKAPKPEFST